MSEKDFSKLQADVCDDLPEPLPIKKICPTCIENPNYIEPDWRNTVNQPYLNEATCEYTCVVTINKYGDYYTGLEFRDPPQGREVALREFIEPALRLMLRHYGKLEADQIICAAFPGIKLEGLAPDELLDLQSNYSLAYQRTSENSFTEREIEIGENRGGDPNNPSADISIEERNSCIPIDEVIEDGIPYAGANRTTEEGDSFEVFDATKFATGEYPEITNPYALELYATVKEFDIDPVQNILKVKVVVPAFVFDQVPAAPTVELAAGNVSNIQTLNSVEFLSEDHGPQLERLAKALETYSSFQSLFWQQQDGYLIFSDTQDVEPLSAEDTQKVDYYASFEQQRIIEYKDKIEQLITANNFALNRFLSGLGNLVRKIKLEFEEGEIYKLKSVKVEVNGCGYSKLTQGFDDFKEFCDKYPTTMHYVANLKNIDMTLRAQQSYPWLDFLVKYTYPQISVIYGKLSQNSLRESGWECIANNAADYATELRDVILSDTVNLFKALEYEFNNVTCSKPGEKPSVLKEGFFGKSLEDTYQAEFDKFFSQESLLKSLIPPSTLRSMSANPSSPALKTLKDQPQGSQSSYAIKMLTLCNVKTIGMASIRCLFSGTTYEDAMAKLIRVSLESMNIDVLGFFIENLPPDAQVKIRQQYERDFANLPLPWEAGYDPGSMSNSNPYQKYKDGFINQALAGANQADTLKQLKPRLEQAIKSADLAQERVNTLQNRVSALDYELRQEIDLMAGQLDQAKIEGIQNRLKAAQSELAETETLYTQLEQQRIDLEAQIIELSGETIQPDAKKSDLEIWRDLPEEEKKALADAANRQANATENTPPGTYGNVLGPLQKTITAAYIDYMMDSLQIDVLLETLDRVPLVSELLPRIIASFKCAYKSPQDPALDDFLSTLTLDVCGDLRNDISLPEIPKIPNFFNTSFLKRISDLFLLKMTQTLTKVLVSLLFKLLETVDAALCNSLNALGQFVVSGNPDIGSAFDDAIRDAFCPSGDEDDAAATKDNIFGGIGGFGGDIGCLYKTLNSVTSKKENIELLAGEGDPNASRRIAEAVNTFCPEYGRVMGSPEDVENFYRQAGSFCPPELLQDLLDQVRQEPDGPVYDSICLTQEELDQFNRDREALLTAGGLDEETARDMIDRANERVLNDLGDVARIMQQGPQGLLDQAIQDLLSRGDPTCSVNKSAITLETPQTRAEKKGLINEFFNPLEKNFFDDLIGEFHSVLGSILRDKSNNNLKLHEFFVNLPIFFPNYHNSASEWDFRKENGSFFYTWMMEEDRQGGFFPDTVGIYLRNKMQMLFPPVFTNNNTLLIEADFKDDGGFDDDLNYGFNLDIERKGSLGNDYEINVKESFYNIFATNVDLDDLGDIFSGNPIVERSDVYYEKLFTHDESFLEGIDATQENQTAYVQVFENLLKRALNRPVEINNVESKNVYQSINNQIFMFVRNSVLNDPNGNLPVGFKFGYNIDEAINFKDLIYVNPNANPNNPETWKYTFEEEDRRLGKSATENPRVHFLDPDIHGGSYKRPKIYIEPATYNGWLGLVRTFVPEVSSCDENTTNFLDLTQITNRVKEVEDNLPFDERLSLPVECRVELPFDRQFSPVNHGLMEGVVLSTVRVHVTEFILKTLPTFASVEMTSRNIEDYFVDVLIEDMKQSMIEQFTLFSVISDYTYWLLFLEQSFQVVERMVLDGMIEMSPALEAAKEEIEAAKGQFRSLGQDFGPASIAMATGAAIIAYGENWQAALAGKESLSDVAAKFNLIDNLSGLTPFRLGLANKINTIYKARDAAKVFLREIVKSEMTLLSDKLNFNMRPRPHIYDINKYLLSRNGITRGSTLRAGESRIEAPVSGGDSGLDYGSIFDVPRNVLEENVFDNLTLSSEEFNKLNQSGIFYLERYVRTTDKSGSEQVYNIKEFGEFLTSTTLDRNAKLSDLYGNLELISDDRILLGSLGVQFGVRLMYCPPSAFSYDLTDLNAERNRAFFHRPAMISIEGEDGQRPWPLTARTVPIAVFEQDIIDRKIKDIDFEDENMGQDLKCYIDKLIETEEYQVFVDYCFPLKSYVSFFATYTFYGFFNSVGVDSSENEESNLRLGDFDFDIWKGLIFNESKDTCRKLFNSVYRSDDDDPQDDVETSRDSTRKFLEGIVPSFFLNLDSSISWWTKSRIVKERPFDADGKDCKNGFQKLFDK